MLPEHDTFGKLAAPARLERQHRILRAMKDGGMALPLVLVQCAILI